MIGESLIEGPRRAPRVELAGNAVSGASSTTSAPPVNVDLPMAPASSLPRSVPSASATPLAPVIRMPAEPTRGRPLRARFPRGSPRTPRARRSRRRPRLHSDPARFGRHERKRRLHRVQAGDRDAARRRARSSVGTCTSRRTVPCRQASRAACRSQPGGARRAAGRAGRRRAQPDAVATHVEGRPHGPERERAGAARERQLGSVRGGRRRARSRGRRSPRSRVASIAPSATLTSPCAPAICSTAGRRGPDVCSIAVAASDSGTILKLALAAPNRSALPRALAVIASVATSTSAARPESERTRSSRWRTSSSPSVIPSDIPAAFCTRHPRRGRAPRDTRQADRRPRRRSRPGS